ncbi:glycosyltransferase family 4 protein [Nocardioides dilutus]
MHVNGVPVVFFNLEGFTPDRPHLLSAQQSPRPRVLLSEGRVLREVVADYAMQLTAAGHRELAGAAPPFGVIDGVQVDELVTRLVRDELRRPDAELPALDSFREWLASPGTLPRPMGPLGRYLGALYESRLDLQVTYPEVRKGNLSGFLGWAEVWGVPDGVPMDLVTRARAASRAETTTVRFGAPVATAAGRHGAPGVTVAGYFTAELGLGQAARLLVTGLETAGVPVETSTYDRTSSRLSVPWADRTLPPGVGSDIAIVCVNADHLPSYLADGGDDVRRDRYTVGVWFWELNEFPAAMRPALDLVDEVWVASDFTAEMLRRASDRPVHVLPLPVHTPVDSGVRPRELAALAGTYVYGFVFDYFSVFERKNPLGLVAAFREAFPTPGEGALLIKSINGDQRPEDRERLILAIDGRPDIVLVERDLPREELDGLLWGIDCFVSMHRAEGFGFTMAESMAIGKPVIATGYSGNLNFMHQGNSRLVRHRLCPVAPGNDPYPVSSVWADPSVRHCARLMRKIKDDPELARKLGARAAHTMQKRHSLQAMGEFALERVSSIRAGS